MIQKLVQASVAALLFSVSGCAWLVGDKEDPRVAEVASFKPVQPERWTLP